MLYVIDAIVYAMGFSMIFAIILFVLFVGRHILDETIDDLRKD